MIPYTSLYILIHGLGMNFWEKNKQFFVEKIKFSKFALLLLKSFFVGLQLVHALFQLLRALVQQAQEGVWHAIRHRVLEQ